MPRYDTIPVGGAPGAQLSKTNWEQFRTSRLPLLLLVLNVLGAIAHGTGVILVRTLARTDFTLSIWHNTFYQEEYETGPVWERGYELTSINPSTVITFFFGLSLTFHIVIACFLTVQRFQPDAWWTQWYMRGLYDNMAVWRWLEYFFSAPLMLLLAAPLMGIREIHSIWAVVGTMAVTILFGWITEIHATNFIDEVTEEEGYKWCGWTLTRRWRPASWRTRCQIHILGYVPYALCWAIIFDRFRLNMQALVGIVPEFVNTSIFLSFTLFTLFGFTQLLHQALPYGPSLYWLGEVIYVTLSFAAKAQLGFIVLFQALVDGAIFDNQLQLVYVKFLNL